MSIALNGYRFFKKKSVFRIVKSAVLENDISR